MFFIDSNIIIESLKENGLEEADKILKEALKNIPKHKFFVNIIVYSESIYILSFRKKEKNELLEKYIFDLFDVFEFLSLDKAVKEKTDFLIKSYKLKPNDAIILATCKHFGIKNLISLDEDFIIPCEKEKINLINSAKSLKNSLLK